MALQLAPAWRPFTLFAYLGWMAACLAAALPARAQQSGVAQGQESFQQGAYADRDAYRRPAQSMDQPYHASHYPEQYGNRPAHAHAPEAHAPRRPEAPAEPRPAAYNFAQEQPRDGRIRTVSGEDFGPAHNGYGPQPASYAAPPAYGGQAAIAGQPVQFRVQGAAQRMELIVNTSRIVTMDHKVPKALVNNTDVVRLTPISPTQIQVSALRAGVTQVNLWDTEDNVYTIDVIVYGDARELEMLLANEFPGASLRVRPLAGSVVLSGFVDSPESVPRIVRMAQDYFPNVINNISVGGVQQVMLKVSLAEVSRTKLRELGFDWATINGNSIVAQSVSGLLSADPVAQTVTSGTGATMAFGIVDGNDSFFGVLRALRQNNLVKILAEPNLVTASGRPAAFNSGGEFPIIVPQSLGTVSIEYKQFGTRVDFVPIVLANGNIRLEVRPTVSEVDPTRAVVLGDTTVPGLRTRWVDTAVEMKAGQTLALAGLLQERIESEVRGIPWLSELPWAGAAFRRVREQKNEIELLILVTPYLVGALDPHEVPPCLPGQTTASPTDVELYGRGYIEVPKRNPHFGGEEFGPYDDFQGQEAYPSHPGGEVIPPGVPQRDAALNRAAPTNDVRASREARQRQAHMPAQPPAQPQAPIRDAHYYLSSEYRDDRAPATARAAQGQNRPAPQAQHQQYQPQNRPMPHPGTNGSASGQPRLIGPIGYDVLE